MNAQLLLNHFDRICEAPEAIPRLKRFVLDLAVRGKLVEQEPDDEPAAALLRRIDAQKAHGKHSRSHKKPANARSTTGITPRIHIPKSWQWSSLGDLVFSRDCDRVPVSSEERSERTKTYDYYGASGVIDKIDGYLFDKPLLLIGEDGANLINRSTPIAFIARGKYWVNNHAHVLDGISENLLRYLEMYINSVDLKPYVTGSAQPKLNQAKLNSIPVALPPEAEQQRIVAKVDELIALCDQLEVAQSEREKRRDWLSAALLHKLNDPSSDEATFRADARFYLEHIPRTTVSIEQIRELRKAIHSLAVCGHLVTHTNGTGLQLIEEIRSDQRKLNTKEKNKHARHEPNGAARTDPLPTIPSHWLLAKLGELTVFGPQNGLSPQPTSRDGAPRAITLTATTSGYFNPNHYKHVEADVSPESEFWLRSGDLLFQRGNTREYVGMAAYYTGEPCEYLYPDLIMKVRLSERLNLAYIHLCCVAPYARCYFSTNASGAQATMPKINQGTLVNLPIPLPPRSEQDIIVTRVAELIGLCDRVVGQIAARRDFSGKLLEAVLTQALAVT